MLRPLLLLAIFLVPLSAMGETVWEYVDRKLEKKKFKRWSLSSWFYQQEKMALQDQWLAMNIEEDHILTEFYIDYAKSTFDVDTADNLNEEKAGWTAEAGMYWGILGFTGRQEAYEDIYTQKEAAINLRVIGSSQQSTNLTFTYGVRQLDGDNTENFQQNFYGGDISLYLVSFFGFDGRFRYYNRELNEQETTELRSQRSQWGAFLDISFIRIFAYQFEENLKFKNMSTQAVSEQQIKGTATGIRLYF
jgi:hypothetical protein